MIKNIVFDLGNVLLDFDPDSYLEELGYTDEIKEQLTAEIFETEEWLQLDRGTISQKQAVEKWQQRNPELADKIAEVMAEWEKILTIKKESLEILKSTAEKSYNLYILSNFHQQAFDYISSKYYFKYGARYFDSF